MFYDVPHAIFVDLLHANSSDAALADKVQENLFALFRAMAQDLPDAAIVERCELSYHHSFPTNPMFKGVWRTRLTEDQAAAMIDDTLAWFSAQGAPFLFWWTGPGTTPANLGELLKQRGLLDMAEQEAVLAPGIKQSGSGAPCMVAELSKLTPDALLAVPETFVIEEVTTEANLLDFKRVFLDSYEIPDWAGQAWVDATQTIGIGKTQWRMYVGYLDGKPVATNMLFLGAGVASVYAVGVIPAARRMGIGAAITLLPLLVARNLGCHHGVLFATEMGVPVYERIGFRLTGAQINRYLWRNPAV